MIKYITMKKIFILLLFTTFLFSDGIKLAVSSNVSYAIKPLIKEFNKKYPDINVRYILGSSGKLTAQIKNRAPYDIFLSANMKYPYSLFEDKIVIEEPKVYVKGRLILFSYKNRELKDLEILNQVKKIAIANPKTAPYGKAAKEVLDNSKLFEKNEKKFIYAENISQTVQYIMTAADVGFIAKSSIYSPKMSKFKKEVNYIDIEPNLYTPIEQGVALISNTKESSMFYEFLFSKEAKKIFKDFGYIVE